MKDAQPQCSGICRIVTDIAKQASSFGYEISLLFLGDGPLVNAMREAGIPVGTVSWTGARRDLKGLWRTRRWLREHPARIVHLHHGGGTVRALCRMSGVDAVVQHIHGRIFEPTGASVSRMNHRGVDALIACSQAVADCFPGRHAEVIYTGIEAGPHPPAMASMGPLRIGVLARLIPLKNIESVINATARLASIGIEVQTEIAGSGPSECGLRDLIGDLKVGERVHAGLAQRR